MVTLTAVIGIAALAGGLQGWLFYRTTWLERSMLVVAGLLLVYPRVVLDFTGIALVVAVVVMQKVRRPEVRAAAG